MTIIFFPSCPNTGCFELSSSMSALELLLLITSWTLCTLSLYETDIFPAYSPEEGALSGDLYLHYVG